MFCREQVAQLRDVVADIREKGAELVVIGNGKPAQAAAFAKERDLEFPLLTDPRRASYRAAGLKRGIASTFRPGVAKSAVRAMASGHVQGSVQGDPWQQGGAFVLGPDGTVHFAYVSREGGDHPDPIDLVAGVPG